ncbi:MAG: DNA primase [Nitrospirota bacterium]
MPSYDNTLDEIKDRIDIIDLISEYVHLKKAGQNWKGLCPFHTEKTPSFTVSPAKQIFHCFGCGTGGDIFTFLLKYENLTFPEAISMLAKKAGVTLKESKKSGAKTGEKEKLLNIHKDAAYFFQQHLAKNSAALDYLKKRGIGSEAQKDFLLGFAPKSWNALLTFLTRKGYKPETINKAGLIVKGSKGNYDTFRERIIFPIHDLRGEIVAFGGRAVSGGEPKYLNSPETPIYNKRKVLYGLNRAKDAIKEHGYTMFMEGYLDVITAHIHGFTSAVAPLGTAITQEHGKLIKRFTEDVIIVFDSDPAGIKAAKSAANILLESGLNVKVLSVPEKEDPDSFLRKKGKAVFQELLDSPLSVVDFIVRQGGEKYQIAREVLETVSKIPNSIIQDDYIKILSEKIDVEERLIRDEFKKIKRQLKGGYRSSATQVRPRPGKRPQEEVYILKLLFQVPEKAEGISVSLSAEDFRDPALQKIFRTIVEGTTNLNELLAKSEEDEKALITEISLMPDIEEHEKALSDCIRHLKERGRKAMFQELQKKIREAEKQKDFRLLKKLQLEQQEILKAGKPQP